MVDVWTCGTCGFEIWKAELTEQEWWEDIVGHGDKEHPDAVVRA